MSLRLLVCIFLGIVSFDFLASSVAAGVILESALEFETEVGPYQMIRPVSSTIIHDGERTPGTENLYNGDGLTHPNPLFAEHGSDPETIWTYEISQDEYPVSVEFDLGEDFLVAEMWIWQPKTEDGANQGIEDFDIIMKDADGNEVGVLMNGIQQIKATGLQPVTRFAAFGECVILPFPECVRFVELRIRSNLGDPDYVSLAEVAFAGRAKSNGVPEPTTLSLGLMGFLFALRVTAVRNRSRRIS